LILLLFNNLNSQPKFPLEIGTKWYIAFWNGQSYNYYLTEINKDTILTDGLTYSILDSYDIDGKLIMSTYYRQSGSQVIEYPDKVILDYAWEEGDTADWSSGVTIGMVKFPLGKYPVSYNNGTYDIGEVCFACVTSTFNINSGFDILMWYHINHAQYYKVVGSIINGEKKGYFGPPAYFALYQNYPNPFNPKTTISFDIPDPCLITLTVYDILGNKIEILLNEEKPEGSYEVEFEGNDLSSGIYFYKLSAESYSSTKKMILLK